MNLDLKGKTVLITGSGSGMGQHMAVGYAQEGANVAVNDINRDAVAETIKMVEEAGGTAHDATADITDLATVKDMIAVTESTLGGIDILVNNAALLTEHTMFLETDPDACMREIAVILHGTMHCSRSVLPGMINRGDGKIVNIATDAARVGQEREVNYSAAKGGVIAFTKVLAWEVARHNIVATTVAPGVVGTNMGKEARISLSFNTFSVDTLGSEENLTHLDIRKMMNEHN